MHIQGKFWLFKLDVLISDIVTVVLWVGGGLVGLGRFIWLLALQV